MVVSKLYFKMSETIRRGGVREIIGTFAVTVLMLALLTIYISLFSSSHAILGQEAEISGPKGQQIILQGMATSSPDPLPGHQSHQSITILRLSSDNTVYSGRITFTTTQPVEVQILHRQMTTNSTEVAPTIPEKFGKLPIIQLPQNNGYVTITNVVPKFTEGAVGTTFAASVPFSGNAVALHNLQGKPFAATYTATAEVLGEAKRADDIEQ